MAQHHHQNQPQNPSNPIYEATNMKRKAFVLLSGGLDSTTCLAIANEDFAGSVEGVSFNYGQRHEKELVRAAEICEQYGFPHTIITLKDLLSGDGVMLTNSDIAVPDISYSDIQGVSPTYVPFRNGTMLSVLTAHVQKYVMSEIDGGQRYNGLPGFPQGQ